MALILPIAAEAQPTVWTNAGTGDWANAANWSLGVPAANEIAEINNGGTAEVTTANVFSGAAFGSGAGNSGTVAVTAGGSLTSSEQQIGYLGGTGVMTVSGGGQVTITGGSHIVLGLGGTGSLTVTGATSLVDISFNLRMATDGGSAVLTLADGGTLEASQIATNWNNTGGTNTINVGSGGTAGILRAPVRNINGLTLTALNFNHTNDITYAFNVSDLVQLTKTAAGTTALTGTNTYTGGTTVSAGVLEGNTGSLPGNITNNAAVRFNQATNGTFSGVISGTGTFTKTGAGVLTLSGVHTYNGNSSVQAGTLLVTGTLASPTTTLTAGTIGGTGTIQALTATGGTVAPGISPGILNTGSLNFNGATTMSVELNGTTAGAGYDQLNVTGTVTLGGAALTGTAGFVPVAGNTFTIINNDGADAVTGTFAGLAQGAVVTIGGRSFIISYTAGTNSNDVVLTAIEGVTVGPAALPDFVVGVAYSTTLTATGGGGGPFTFALAGGTLPAGITLSAAGVLEGVPTTGGPFSFTVSATDALAQSGTAAYAGTVLLSVPTLPPAGVVLLALLLGAAVWWHRRLRAPAWS